MRICDTCYPHVFPRRLTSFETQTPCPPFSAPLRTKNSSGTLTSIRSCNGVFNDYSYQSEMEPWQGSPLVERSATESHLDLHTMIPSRVPQKLGISMRDQKRVSVLLVSPGILRSSVA